MEPGARELIEPLYIPGKESTMSIFKYCRDNHLVVSKMANGDLERYCKSIMFALVRKPNEISDEEWLNRKLGILIFIFCANRPGIPVSYPEIPKNVDFCYPLLCKSFLNDNKDFANAFLKTFREYLNLISQQESKSVLSLSLISNMVPNTKILSENRNEWKNIFENWFLVPFSKMEIGDANLMIHTAIFLYKDSYNLDLFKELCKKLLTIPEDYGCFGFQLIMNNEVFQYLMKNNQDKVLRIIDKSLLIGKLPISYYHKMLITRTINSIHVSLIPFYFSSYNDANQNIFRNVTESDLFVYQKTVNQILYQIRFLNIQSKHGKYEYYTMYFSEQKKPMNSLFKEIDDFLSTKLFCTRSSKRHLQINESDEYLLKLSELVEKLISSLRYLSNPNISPLKTTNRTVSSISIETLCVISNVFYIVQIFEKRISSKILIYEHAKDIVVQCILKLGENSNGIIAQCFCDYIFMNIKEQPFSVLFFEWLYEALSKRPQLLETFLVKYITSIYEKKDLLISMDFQVVEGICLLIMIGIRFFIMIPDERISLYVQLILMHFKILFDYIIQSLRIITHQVLVLNVTNIYIKYVFHLKKDYSLEIGTHPFYRLYYKRKDDCYDYTRELLTKAVLSVFPLNEPTQVSPNMRHHMKQAFFHDKALSSCEKFLIFHGLNRKSSGPEYDYEYVQTSFENIFSGDLINEKILHNELLDTFLGLNIMNRYSSSRSESNSYFVYTELRIPITDVLSNIYNSLSDDPKENQYLVSLLSYSFSQLKEAHDYEYNDYKIALSLILGIIDHIYKFSEYEEAVSHLFDDMNSYYVKTNSSLFECYVYGLFFCEGIGLMRSTPLYFYKTKCFFVMCNKDYSGSIHFNYIITKYLQDFQGSRSFLSISLGILKLFLLVLPSSVTILHLTSISPNLFSDNPKFCRVFDVLEMIIKTHEPSFMKQYLDFVYTKGKVGLEFVKSFIEICSKNKIFLDSQCLQVYIKGNNEKNLNSFRLLMLLELYRETIPNEIISKIKEEMESPNNPKLLIPYIMSSTINDQSILNNCLTVFEKNAGYFVDPKVLKGIKTKISPNHNIHKVIADKCKDVIVANAYFKVFPAELTEKKIEDTMNVFVKDSEKSIEDLIKSIQTIKSGMELLSIAAKNSIRVCKGSSNLSKNTILDSFLESICVYFDLPDSLFWKMCGKNLIQFIYMECEYIMNYLFNNLEKNYQKKIDLIVYVILNEPEDVILCSFIRYIALNGLSTLSNSLFELFCRFSQNDRIIPKLYYQEFLISSMNKYFSEYMICRSKNDIYGVFYLYCEALFNLILFTKKNDLIIQYIQIFKYPEFRHSLLYNIFKKTFFVDENTMILCFNNLDDIGYELMGKMISIALKLRQISVKGIEMIRSFCENGLSEIEICDGFVKNGMSFSLSYYLVKHDLCLAHHIGLVLNTLPSHLSSKDPFIVLKSLKLLYILSQRDKIMENYFSRILSYIFRQKYMFDLPFLNITLKLIEISKKILVVFDESLVAAFLAFSYESIANSIRIVQVLDKNSDFAKILPFSLINNLLNKTEEAGVIWNIIINIMRIESKNIEVLRICFEYLIDHVIHDKFPNANIPLEVLMNTPDEIIMKSNISTYESIFKEKCFSDQKMKIFYIVLYLRRQFPCDEIMKQMIIQELKGFLGLMRVNNPTALYFIECIIISFEVLSIDVIIKIPNEEFIRNDGLLYFSLIPTISKNCKIHDTIVHKVESIISELYIPGKNFICIWVDLIQKLSIDQRIHSIRRVITNSQTNFSFRIMLLCSFDMILDKNLIPIRDLMELLLVIPLCLKETMNFSMLSNWRIEMICNLLSSVDRIILLKHAPCHTSLSVAMHILILIFVYTNDSYIKNISLKKIRSLLPKDQLNRLLFLLNNIMVSFWCNEYLSLLALLICEKSEFIDTLLDLVKYIKKSASKLFFLSVHCVFDESVKDPLLSLLYKSLKSKYYISNQYVVESIFMVLVENNIEIANNPFWRSSNYVKIPRYILEELSLFESHISLPVDRLISINCIPVFDRNRTIKELSSFIVYSFGEFDYANRLISHCDETISNSFSSLQDTVSYLVNLDAKSINSLRKIDPFFSRILSIVDHISKLPSEANIDSIKKQIKMGINNFIQAVSQYLPNNPIYREMISFLYDLYNNHNPKRIINYRLNRNMNPFLSLLYNRVFGSQNRIISIFPLPESQNYQETLFLPYETLHCFPNIYGYTPNGYILASFDDVCQLCQNNYDSNSQSTDLINWVRVLYYLYIHISSPKSALFESLIKGYLKSFVQLNLFSQLDKSHIVLRLMQLLIIGSENRESDDFRVCDEVFDSMIKSGPFFFSYFTMNMYYVHLISEKHNKFYESLKESIPINVYYYLSTKSFPSRDDIFAKLKHISLYDVYTGMNSFILNMKDMIYDGLYGMIYFEQLLNFIKDKRGILDLKADLTQEIVDNSFIQHCLSFVPYSIKQKIGVLNNLLEYIDSMPIQSIVDRFFEAPKPYSSYIDSFRSSVLSLFTIGPIHFPSLSFSRNTCQCFLPSIAHCNSNSFSINTIFSSGLEKTVTFSTITTQRVLEVSLFMSFFGLLLQQDYLLAYYGFKFENSYSFQFDSSTMISYYNKGTVSYNEIFANLTHMESNEFLSQKNCEKPTFRPVLTDFVSKNMNRAEYLSSRNLLLKSMALDAFFSKLFNYSYSKVENILFTSNFESLVIIPREEADEFVSFRLSPQLSHHFGQDYKDKFALYFMAICRSFMMASDTLNPMIEVFSKLPVSINQLVEERDQIRSRIDNISLPFGVPGTEEMAFQNVQNLYDLIEFSSCEDEKPYEALSWF